MCIKNKMSENNNKKNQKKQWSAVFNIFYPHEASSPAVLGVDDESETPSDFEEAIEATGYGLFNALLLLAVLPGGWANAFNTTTMAYVLPAAECDLELTLFHKGVLNAITYTGMISSGFIWGFLSDTRGRRSLLIMGYLADAICNFLGSTSQSFYVLATFRFLNGFILNGPYAINMTYVAEYHGVKYRSKSLLWCSFFMAIAWVILPILAWAIIPQSWSFTLFDGAFVYNSWRLFIFISGIPSLLASSTLLFFYESPRFLMSQGRNEEALKVFQWMYSLNTGKAPETFPVKSLCQEGRNKQIERSASRRRMSVWDKTRNGFAQIKPLFREPYRRQILLINLIQLGSVLSMNTLRLWMPQLFALMENFDYENRDPSLGPPVLCDMISLTPSANATVNANFNSTITDTCVVTLIPDRVYVDSVIIASTMVVGCTLAGSIINLIGKKNLLHFSSSFLNGLRGQRLADLLIYGIAAICSIGVNWSPNSDVTLATLSIYTALTSISVTTVISIIVDLMPTSLRTMAVSMAMSIGRIGAMSGNLLFPILLSSGCMAPFLFVGSFLLVCFISSIFIPKPPAKLV